MAVTVIPSSLLVVIVTMAILSQFSTPGNAFVKKLLETKLLASMMKELNNQPFYDKYSVSYSVPPLKLLPMNTDTVETTMPVPLITRMKMMKSPMDMYQLEHIAPYYKAAYSYFDHPAHQNHHHPDHEEPGITRHPDHSVQHHPHIEDHHFDHDHDHDHDDDDGDDNEHDHHYHHDHLAHFSDHEMYKQSSMNNMRNNLYSQATAVMKTGALKARPWPVPSRGLRKTNLDFNENFSLGEIEPTNSGFAMNAMNGEMGSFGPSVDVPSTIEGSMDISRGGIKNLNTAVEKIKQLNKNDDVSEISEEQMKRPITQNMEKDFENDESKKKNKNESLAEMKPENIDQLNIMKPFDMIAVSRNLTRLPAKTMNKTQNHGKMESILYSELTQNQGNRGSVYLSGVPPKMILPRYHTPMSPVQFTMRLPSSQNGANEVGQSLVGRMRNAMGNFGLGGTRRGNWNQLTANIAKFHDINQGTMGQRLTSAAQKIMLKPLMIPNSPPAMMDMYNSMPPFNLGMHPAMEGMLLDGAVAYLKQPSQPRPKEGLPAYLGSIQQSPTQIRNKPHHSESMASQHQQLRRQMEKIMDEFTRRPAHFRQSPHVASQLQPELSNFHASSGSHTRVTTESVPSNLKRLQKNKQENAENQVAEQTSALTLKKQERDSVSEAKEPMNSTIAVGITDTF